MVDVLKKMMLHVAEFMEIILAIYLVAVLVMIIGRTVVCETPLIWAEDASIHHFLEESLMLAIAIEFVKMLSMHTPGTLIEVLLFAIARHMIVESLTPLQTLLLVCSIVVLFAARKYLLTAHDQKGMNEHVHGARGILKEMAKLREEKHAVETAFEETEQRKHRERAEKELLKKERENNA
ncbi:MAG: hypothetical protein Q4D81_06315 [Eubacteriales bacterium]|nr:hypothetical protein [Eubacteriales bacterium]